MEQRHLSIVGFGKNRAEADFYPTPESTTRALLEREVFEGNIWECACGDGQMSKVLREYCPIVFSSDIREDDSIDGSKGIDFLKSDKIFNNIITNPPYRYAKEFVIHSKKCSTNKIAMLLKLVFLEGKGRYEMFQDIKFPLKKILVFCRRVNFLSEKDPRGEKSSTMAIAWFIWDKKYIGKPYLEWIK